MSSDRYDVIVIGSGPAGGTTAAKLAETGKRVLLLERGDFLPRERGNWDSKVVFAQGKYVADETFYDSHDRPFQPELHYFVGGNSKVYGAALFRLQPSDFGEVRHPNGVSPAWPIGYADLEPYYVQAEHLYWVHGKHGEDPFAGPASRDYRFPPVRHEPRIQALSDGLENSACTRSTCRSASISSRTSTATPPHTRAASAATGWTASPAWSAPRPTPSGRSSGRRWPRTRTSPC